MNIWIGHDDREQAAYDVAAFSLRDRCSGDVHIHSLKHKKLRQSGVFWREWRIDHNGQYWDVTDGKPFSTQFSHTRFLVPHLAKSGGLTGWAMFVDCDFLFLGDVAELFASADPTKAVMCVQHDFQPPEGLKMDACIQARYRRKNWSSCMLFNLDDPRNNRLTPECVNEADGSWLHQFGWLPDDGIGALDPKWNYLVGHSTGEAAAVHFTEGGPWFDVYDPSEFDDLWSKAYVAMRREELEWAE